MPSEVDLGAADAAEEDSGSGVFSERKRSLHVHTRGGALLSALSDRAACSPEMSFTYPNPLR